MTVAGGLAAGEALVDGADAEKDAEVGKHTGTVNNDKMHAFATQVCTCGC